MERAKHEAARSRRTLTAVDEDASRSALDRDGQVASESYAVRPLTGNGLRARVNLDDSAALLDLMDER
ncbi:MAG: hypothetical protein ACT4QF_02685 [Sporichthyaceae bacterium]